MSMVVQTNITFFFQRHRAKRFHLKSPSFKRRLQRSCPNSRVTMPCPFWTKSKRTFKQEMSSRTRAFFVVVFLTHPPGLLLAAATPLQHRQNGQICCKDSVPASSKDCFKHFQGGTFRNAAECPRSSSFSADPKLQILSNIGVSHCVICEVILSCDLGRLLFSTLSWRDNEHPILEAWDLFVFCSGEPQG